MSLPRILIAAAGGFLLMSTVGLQALVALFASLPLARHRKKKYPDFDLARALRRITRITLFSAAALAAVTLAVLCLTSAPTTLGYLAGMILGFLVHLPRMSPNSTKNQRHFVRFYIDCDPLYEEDEDDLTATRQLPTSEK